MKLEKWALLAEVAAAFAIVVTLIVLIIQVQESARQTALNTQAMQLAAYQDLIRQINELNILRIEGGFDYQTLLTAPAFAEIQNEEAMNAVLFLILRHADLAWYQHNLGMLSSERMESAIAPMTAMMCAPLFQEFWPDSKDAFVPAFRDYIDSRLDQDC